MFGRNDYEDRQERRRERLENAAAKAEKSADAHYITARALVPSCGSPILIGHHSEKRHRRALAKADNHMRAGIADMQRARSLESRAHGVGTAGVSSDDPDAVDKLTAKRDALKAKADAYKDANAKLRKGLPIEEIGAPEWVIKTYHRLASLGALKSTPKGAIFPAYATANIRAEIRRVEKRLEDAAAMADSKPLEITGDGFRLWEDRDENRLRFEFPGKPSDDVRAVLKSRGFKFSQNLDADWVRMITPQARNVARWLAESELPRIMGQEAPKTPQAGAQDAGHATEYNATHLKTFLQVMERAGHDAVCMQVCRGNLVVSTECTAGTLDGYCDLQGYRGDAQSERTEVAIKDLLRALARPSVAEIKVLGGSKGARVCGVDIPGAFVPPAIPHVWSGVVDSWMRVPMRLLDSQIPTIQGQPLHRAAESFHGTAENPIEYDIAVDAPSVWCRCRSAQAVAAVATKDAKFMAWFLGRVEAQPLYDQIDAA